MHDVLEGALQYEAKLMLRQFIQGDQYFTLQELNSTIECFDFGYAEGKSRPTLITTNTLSSSDNALKQNGILMHVHGHLLDAFVPSIPDVGSRSLPPHYGWK